MKKRIISFMTALSMTLMIFTSMPTAAALAITTMDVTSFTASADTANGTHTFTNPDTFFFTDEENKFDYKEYSLTQAQIGKAINHPGAFVNSVASITVNYKASDDISGIIIAHGSDEANGWMAEESVSISQGSNSVTTAKPIKVDNGAVSFQIKAVNSDTNLIGKTLKINSVTLTGVGYVSEKIDAANFTYSIFNNTSMKIGDSFTVSYNAANTPPAAKYSFKYKVPKSDGSGYDYYTPVLNNKVNGTDGQEATGLKVTSSTAGDITTYTFTAIAASAAEFELNIEVSASGTWSDTAFGGSSAYKVVDSTPAPTLTFAPETANVNVGRTTTVTIIGKNTDGYEYTAKSYSDAIATATANGTVVTVTGVTIGLVKIKVTGKKSGADDITAEFTVNVPHDLEKHDAVSATCTTDGNEAYWTCSVKGCKKIFSNEDSTAEFDEIPVIPKLGHIYVNGTCTRCGNTPDPTMTISPKTLTVPIGETAVITETVTNGGDCMYNETTSDADIVAITASSALENGVRTVTVEGRSAGTAVITLKIIKSDVEVIVETCNVTVTDGTTPTYTLTPAAATVKTGLSNGQVFTLEGYTAIEQIYWDIDPAYAAVYTGSGNSLESNQCRIVGTAVGGPVTLTAKSLDGDVLGTATITFTDDDIPSHTHTLTAHAAVDATCTAAGNSAYWTCSDCDKIFSDGNGTAEISAIPTIPALGHNYVDGVCTRCGANETVHTHVFGTEWKYSDTRHWHECACGEKADEALHTPDGGTVTKQPTAYETGVRTYYCTVCGGLIFSETIPAAGTDTAPVIPNSTSNGTTVSKEPYLQNDSGKKGWDVISDDILSTPDGEAVKVKMNGATELPQNIVSNIAGRDIDLVLDMGSGFSWTINGMNVTRAKNVDMGVRKISRIPKNTVQEFFGDSKTVQIDLRHNGNFGFTATLTIDIGNKYSGMYANSYCYKSRNFEFGDSGEIVNGKASLQFAHASSWLITIDDYPVMEDVSSGAAAHSAGTPIDMSNSTSEGITIPEFDEKKKLRLSNSKRRYRILRKRKLDDMVFVL